MKIKVVQFISGMNIGGAETIVKNYCLLLDKEKMNLTLLCIHNHHSMYDKELKNAGIHVIYADDEIDKRTIGPKQIKRVFHRMLRPLVLGRILRDINPDIIHSHLCVNRFIRMAGLNPQTRIVHTVHSEPEALWKKSCEGRRDMKALQCLGKQYCVKFIALHQDMKKQGDRMFGVHDTQVFHNGIDIAAFADAGEKKALRRMYRVNEAAFVIGNVASFSPVKNHAFLLDVFYELQKKHPDSFLWLAGDGGGRNAIQKKARSLGILDKIVFWGKRGDVPQLLKMMDAVGFPSFYEGLSVALIESQAAGIPALVSKEVSRYTKISNLITFMELSQGAGKWADRLLEYKQNRPFPQYTQLEEWDMKNVVKRLERYYERLAAENRAW